LVVEGADPSAYVRTTGGFAIALAQRNGRVEDGVSASHEASAPSRFVAVARWTLVAATAALAVYSVARATGLFDTASAAAAEQYVCPMHPEVASSQPALCPMCNMRLEARAQAPSADSTTAPRSVPVRRRQVTRTFAAPAVLVVPDGQLVSVSARAQGWIATLPVAEVGRRVERGQVLATLDSPDLFRLQQKYLNAVRWSRAGQPNVQPGHDGDSTGDLVAEARTQLGLAGLSGGDIDAIVAGGTPRRAVALRSPIDGVVIRKQADRGGFAPVGQELFAIADLGTMWAVAEVPESSTARLGVGERVRVELAAGPAVDGAIAFIHPTVDEASRTVSVRVVLPNRDGALRPGMSATVHLASAPVEVQVVPAASVVDTGSRPIVYVARDGRHERRAVVLGARIDDDVEVVSGLAAGELVVGDGAFLLESESRRRAAPAAP
jgi:membrane fusion protein, copper/silver efflux system